MYTLDTVLQSTNLVKYIKKKYNDTESGKGGGVSFPNRGLFTGLKYHWVIVAFL